MTVAQEHVAGAEAEIDFGEFRAQVASEVVRLWLFVMRLSCSARAFAMVFTHQRPPPPTKGSHYLLTGSSLRKYIHHTMSNSSIRDRAGSTVDRCVQVASFSGAVRSVQIHSRASRMRTRL